MPLPHFRRPEAFFEHLTQKELDAKRLKEKQDLRIKKMNILYGDVIDNKR